MIQASAVFKTGLRVAAIAVALSAGSSLGDPIVPGITPIDGVELPAPVAAPKAQAQQPGGVERVSVLVHLQAGVDRGPVRQFAQAQGGMVRFEYKILPNVINLRGIPRPALEALLNVPGVARWEHDAPVQAHMNDSTPLIRALQSQINGAGLSADGSGVRVCILDTGIDSDSAMYSDRIDAAAGRDFVNGDNNPEDDNGHGSHVAGTAVGGDNLSVDFGCVGSEPFHGVAPNATLVGIKVLNSSGSGSFSGIIAGIDYGANQTASGGRCDVINMSLGGGAFSGTCDGDSAAAAANNAVDAGVVVVASSGNEGNSNAMGTPACGSKVISVGATYDDDYPNCEFPTLTSFEFCTCVNIFCCGSCVDNSPSVDQITCMSNRSTQLDVTAPGCVTFSADSTASPNGIVGFCGTSMASPHVAGLAALLLSADPSLTPAEVRQFIRDGAIDLGAGGFDSVYGYGRIDAINSLSLLGPGCSTNGDCDDGNVCNGSETCVGGSCQAGTPLNCNDGNACTTDSCNTSTGCVNTPINCDDGDPCTADSCDPGSGCQNVGPGCVDNDGCCPAGCTIANDNDCPPFVCGNGTCEEGEDCDTCSADCFSGSGAVCGNDVCETADGENCVNCAADCNGVQSGRPQNRYCCGDGGGTNPIGCNDSRCTGSGNTCSTVPGVGSCCGDGICEGAEDASNCAVDCATCTVNADCDDGNACTTDVCSGGTCSNTPINCDDGNACTADSCSNGVCSNTPITCNDGNACTVDTCNSSTGCVFTPVACGPSDGCCPSGCSSGSDPDCPSGPVCGNDICEIGAGENCTNCSADCNGVTNGPPNRRYCCGTDVNCSDPRCTGNGNTCQP